MAFTNLPGVSESLQDGNLPIQVANNNPVVLVLGTAGKGPGDTIFTAGTTLSSAKSLFGTSGTLVRGMFETSIGGALNIAGFRFGATSCSLLTPFGVTITPNTEGSSSGSDYLLQWINASLQLLIWRASDGTLVYDNSPASPSDAVNTGEVAVTGTFSSAAGNFGGVPGSVNELAISGLAVSGTYTAGSDGLTLSRMETYQALHSAYKLLDNQVMDVIIPMGVYLDDLNVMDMSAATVSSLSLTTISGFPTANTSKDALGLLYTEEYEGTDYFWWWFPTQPNNPTFSTSQITTATGVGQASKTKKIDGTSLVAADFHEVNFGFQLANFCFIQGSTNMDMTGVIGVKPPGSYSLKDVSTWIGTMPVTTTNGSGQVVVSTNGTGLLGNKFMSGRVSVGGNSGTPGFIIDGVDGLFNGGFIATDSGWLDDTQLKDSNEHLIDIGKYINVIGAWPVLANGSRTGSYTATGAATYGGFYSVLPINSAPTNKVLNSMRLPFRINSSKLDLLAGQRFVFFHQKPRGIVVSDAPTAARKDSDYNRLSTVRQVTSCVNAIRAVAEPFLGEGLTGPMQAALDTAIDRALGAKVKAGEINRYQYQVIITPQMRVLGQATVQLKLVPAFELRQITVVVALAAV